MRDGTTGTPQGDGFAIGRITSSGQVRLTGETGDGQPFTVAGYLQEDLTLQVGVGLGSDPLDYLIGHLSFATDASATVGGSLDWISRHRVNEQYIRNFVRTSQPIGARFVPPSPGAPVLNTSNGNTVSLRLLDDLGKVLLNRALIFDRNDHANDGQSSHLVIDRSTGLFRGSALSPGNTTRMKFHGVVVPSLNRGSGQFHLNGPIGAAEISAN
jgi:hypothetical protein